MLHGSGLTMHKDLKASNIFSTQIDKTGNSEYKFVDSGNVKLKKDLAYHSFWVSVQDYWGSDGIVTQGSGGHQIIHSTHSHFKEMLRKSRENNFR